MGTMCPRCGEQPLEQWEEYCPFCRHVTNRKTYKQRALAGGGIVFAGLVIILRGAIKNAPEVIRKIVFRA